MRRTATALLACALPMLGLGASGALAAPRPATSPIKHVVVLLQENHSFNDLLGQLCISENNRCAASDTGTISDGTRIPLKAEKDVPPAAGHEPADQLAAIHGGAMDGWDHVGECDAAHHYQCLTQAPAGRVPTLWKLADTYTISDMTFETSTTASWGSHLEMVAATMDSFLGDEPESAINRGPGGGCDSHKDTAWQGPGYPAPIQVPSCIPDALGRGPYRTSPVKYVPTIMDSLDTAGLGWHIYAPDKRGKTGYGWAICPTFFECLGSNQRRQMRQPQEFETDARAGKLRALSIVVPDPVNSQHNGRSLMAGDDWIARNVDAVMQGPDWSSTAIFITYDDCGCFYDPVRPPAGYGVRVPMVIVSPFAKAHAVDHTTASLASLLSFVEGNFGFGALPGGSDAGAYDYRTSFRLDQRPLPPIPLPLHGVPQSSLDYIAAHPPDPNDPT